MSGLASDNGHAVEARPQQPSVILLEDRLRVENLQLKLEKLELQLQILKLQLQEKLQQRDVILMGMGEVRTDLLQKYNIDIQRVHINDDGSYSTVGNPQG